MDKKLIKCEICFEAEVTPTQLLYDKCIRKEKWYGQQTAPNLLKIVIIIAAITAIIMISQGVFS